MPQRPARVRAFAKQLPTGVADEVDYALEPSAALRRDPALVLADIAAEENARLLVVGAGEHGKLARRLIGSVADLRRRALAVQRADRPPAPARLSGASSDVARPGRWRASRCAMLAGMETMSALDASFLHVEDAVSHMHIGSVGIFEGPAPPQQVVLDAIAAKLHLVPRYRQHVRFPPLALARPVWVDDRHFHLDYHVRRTALPAPGGDEELRNLVGRVMAQKLDRSKPLWEMWIAEGLDDGRWALVSKLHHCMVDGVSGTDLLSVVFDDERRRRRAEARAVEARAGAEHPAHRRLGAGPPGEDPVRRRRAACGRRRARRPRPRPGGRHRARPSSSLRTLLRPPAGTSLNGPIGPHRRWAWARGRLADVKAIRTEHGGTVNDVVLAVIARGFRDLLHRARRARRGPRRAHDGARVGAHAGRARHLQQQGLGDVRRPPRAGSRTRSSASRRSAPRCRTSRRATRRWPARR